jgi:hypothetical protein
MLTGAINPVVDSMFLPDSGPFALRFNCQVGQLALDQKTYIANAGEFVVLHSDNWRGSLGKTEDAIWTRVIFVPTPQFAAKTDGEVPANTICQAFIKSESRDAFGKASVIAMQKHRVGLAQLVCSFKSEGRSSDGKNYFAFGFEFREPSKEESKFMGMVLEFAKGASAAMIASHNAGLICIDGKTPEEIERLFPASVSSLAAENRVALPALAAA